MGELVKKSERSMWSFKIDSTSFQNWFYEYKLGREVQSSSDSRTCRHIHILEWLSPD